MKRASESSPGLVALFCVLKLVICFPSENILLLSRIRSIQAFLECTVYIDTGLELLAWDAWPAQGLCVGGTILISSFCALRNRSACIQIPPAMSSADPVPAIYYISYDLAPADTGHLEKQPMSSGSDASPPRTSADFRALYKINRISNGVDKAARVRCHRRS